MRTPDLVNKQISNKRNANKILRRELAEINKTGTELTAHSELSVNSWLQTSALSKLNTVFRIG